MNNSKQAVLSIVGIAILVIAVVGVSFAFFTYSKNGTTNNVITTGTIEFDSNVDTAAALSLSNQFPQTNEDGKANESKYQFNVHGTIPGTANSVYYGVFLVEGTTPSGKDAANKFAPTQISAYLTTDGGANSTIVPTYGTTGAALTNAVTTTPGLKVAYGTITNSGVAQTHNFTLTLWVNDTVTISDTDSTKTYRAHAYNAETWPEGSESDTRKVYSDMWYSVKVNVEANDTTSYAS